ncbi:MAG: hypothetical protein IK120_03140 [Muribaculaceae bacterium]|nr:hypothetical protein [Muribaculaceae bacterium]
MKKFCVSLALAAISLIGYAQVVNVASVKKVILPQGTAVDKAVVSPAGNYVVVSDLNARGLKKIDLTTGKSTVLSKTASNYDVRISADGSQVMFREYSVDQDRLRWATLKTVNTSTLKEQTLVAKSRDIQGTAFNGNTAAIVNKGKFIKKPLGAKADAPAPVASIDHGALKLTVNGVTRNLSPQGTAGQSYIWPSVSPNGKQVLYYLVGEGCFVCDLNGKNVKRLGALSAPRWIDDSTIVGMRDEDNGVYITRSVVIAKNIENLREQQISSSSIIALYPSASKKNIVFSTDKGELYLVTLK